MSMRRIRCIVFALLGLATSAAGSALAQEAGCKCLAGSGGVASNGRLTAVSGQVLASREGGLAPARTGMQLRPGSQVLTGPGASANVTVGSCSFRLKANSEVVLERIGPKICARVDQIDVTQTAAIPASGAALFLFGGVATAGGTVEVGVGTQPASR